MAILFTLLFGIVLVFGWYRWVYMRAYKQFPATRMDTTWLLRMALGWYPKKFTPTSYFFRTIVERAGQFFDEGLYIVWIFRPYLFVFSDETIKDIVNESAVKYKSHLFEVTREIFGNGLVGQHGDTWKWHRKQINPAFNLSVLKGKIPICNNNAVKLLERLQTVENRPIEDLIHLLKDCSFKIMSESVLGKKLNIENYASKAQHFKRMLARASNLGFMRLSYPWLQVKSLLPYSPLGRKYLETVKEMHRFADEVVEELEKSIAKSGNMESDMDGETEVCKSMAEVIIQQHMKNHTFTTEELRDHFENIIIAGFDSTAIAMMWCMYLLGHNPDVQEKVYSEVKSKVPAGHVTYDHIGKLSYLDCVLKETLRLYPPLAFYARKTGEEIKCGKYTIPKNTDVVFAPFILHRNPHVYPDPEKFDPERFSGTSEIRPWMHIPFAEGYRNCIGKNFAMMEAKIILAHVVRRYKIVTLNKIDDSELDWTMVLKPLKRIRIQFTSRSDES